jgi:hypothetical protein
MIFFYIDYRLLHLCFITCIELFSISNITAKDFFTTLQEIESRNMFVGTVHTKTKDPMGPQKRENSGDWNCAKCGTTNFKHTVQCTKCHAMKRISEYR